jgi:hypothetical protein
MKEHQNIIRLLINNKNQQRKYKLKMKERKMGERGK